MQCFCCFVDILATIVNPGLTRLQTGQNMFQTERKEEKKKKKDKHIGSFQADLRVSISYFFKRPTIAETSLRIDAV